MKKIKNPTLADLEAGGPFELIEDLSHETLPIWLRTHLFSLTWVTAVYWFGNLTAGAVVWAVWRKSGQSLLQGFPTLCLGMVLGHVALIPIHENIHALAYRLVGATNTRVRYDLRRFSAVCLAPGAVLGRAQFLFVCLAPALILNSLMAISLFLIPSGTFALGLSGALLLHIGGCSGDIALVNFLWLRRRQKLYTFDDPHRPRTAFYAET